MFSVNQVNALSLYYEQRKQSSLVRIKHLSRSEAVQFFRFPTTKPILLQHRSIKQRTQPIMTHYSETSKVIEQDDFKNSEKYGEKNSEKQNSPHHYRFRSVAALRNPTFSKHPTFSRHMVSQSMIAKPSKLSTDSPFSRTSCIN